MTIWELRRNKHTSQLTNRHYVYVNWYLNLSFYDLLMLSVRLHLSSSIINATSLIPKICMFEVEEKWAGQTRMNLELVLWKTLKQHFGGYSLQMIVNYYCRIMYQHFKVKKPLSTTFYMKKQYLSLQPIQNLATI